MNPTKEFRDYMISQGAALVGIGDLTTVLYLTKLLPPEPASAGSAKTVCL